MSVFRTNEATGTVTHWEDQPDGGLVIAHAQNVTAPVEYAKAEYRAFDERAGWKGDTHKVGWIPLTVLFDLERRGIAPHQDQAAFRRWLNDPDNRAFRTRPGRI